MPHREPRQHIWGQTAVGQGGEGGEGECGIGVGGPGWGVRGGRESTRGWQKDRTETLGQGSRSRQGGAARQKGGASSRGSGKEDRERERAPGLHSVGLHLLWAPGNPMEEPRPRAGHPSPAQPDQALPRCGAPAEQGGAGPTQASSSETAVAGRGHASRAPGSTGELGAQHGRPPGTRDKQTHANVRQRRPRA